MTRLEENTILIDKMNKKAEQRPTGSYEMIAFQLGAIVILLGDISRSLAMLADKAESEEKQETVTEFADRCRECGREKVLDKIKAELHATAEMHEDGDYYLREEWIDEVIDKHKAGGKRWNS